MRWGDFVQVNSLDNAPGWIDMLAEQAKQSVHAGLEHVNPDKPVRIGWYIEQD